MFGLTPAMRIASIDRISSSSEAPQLPLKIQQVPSRRGGAVLLTLLVPIALAMFAPFWLIGAEAATDPAIRAWIAEHPASIAPLLCGVAVWFALLGWPVVRLLKETFSRRSVLIDQGTVAVSDVGPWGRRTWSADLTAFQGLAHHVRATLGGVRHELILVHPDREKLLLVAMAPRMLESEVTQFADMLGVPVIPPAAIYGFNRPKNLQTTPVLGSGLPALSQA
jgi:hypothetical protein